MNSAENIKQLCDLEHSCSATQLRFLKCESLKLAWWDSEVRSLCKLKEFREGTGRNDGISDLSRKMHSEREKIS